MNQLVDPDAMRRDTGPKDEKPVREFAASYFLGGNGPTMRQEMCLFTHSPDGHLIIDRLNDAVVTACGFSGHGFKFSSAVGEVLASLAMEGQTTTISTCLASIASCEIQSKRWRLGSVVKEHLFKIDLYCLACVLAS